MDYKVNVYKNSFSDEVIARVTYTDNLDFWDGSNRTCGSTGRHKGLTKLRDGRYVLIHGTQWQGERDWAEVITPEEALQEILRGDNLDLLEEKRFEELADLYEKMIEANEEVTEEA
jgi:hypothetical protein